MYVALKPLHKKITDEYIPKGDLVDLSHLTYDQIEMLKGIGAVREATAEEIAKANLTPEAVPITPEAPAAPETEPRKPTRRNNGAEEGEA